MFGVCVCLCVGGCQRAKSILSFVNLSFGLIKKWFIQQKPLHDVNTNDDDGGDDEHVPIRHK